MLTVSVIIIFYINYVKNHKESVFQRSLIIFLLKNNQMNFLNKRKRKEDNREDASLVQPSKKSRVISLVKKVGHGLCDKIAVAVQALTRRTYTQDVRSTLFTTPAGPLRTARYLMTPLEPFSVKKSSLEWRYVREALTLIEAVRHR